MEQRIAHGKCLATGSMLCDWLQGIMPVDCLETANYLLCCCLIVKLLTKTLGPRTA